MVTGRYATWHAREVGGGGGGGGVCVCVIRECICDWVSSFYQNRINSNKMVKWGMMMGRYATWHVFSENFCKISFAERNSCDGMMRGHVCMYACMNVYINICACMYVTTNWLNTQPFTRTHTFMKINHTPNRANEPNAHAHTTHTYIHTYIHTLTARCRIPIGGCRGWWLGISTVDIIWLRCVCVCVCVCVLVWCSVVSWCVCGLNK